MTRMWRCRHHAPLGVVLALAAAGLSVPGRAAETEKAEGSKPKVEAQVLEHRSFKVVGVELPDGGDHPYLIMYAWIRLSTKIAQVRHQVRPHVLYGVWHRKPDAKVPSYMVAVEVSEVSDVPEGLTTFTVPAGKFVMRKHRGNVGAIGETYGAIMEWMKQTGSEHREGPTFEVYDTRQRITDDYELPIYEPIQ